MKKLAVAVFGFMMAGVAVGANWTNDLKNIPHSQLEISNSN